MTSPHDRPDESVLDRAEPVAAELALEAGRLVRGMLTEVRAITHKGAVDLVTDADQASEVIIANGIRAAFPEHRLIGEEGARGVDDSLWGWVVDPIDGTTNYAHRYPHFAVSIGLEYEGQVVLGVVYDPMRDEMFRARLGKGAYLNDVPIHVSATDTLIESLLASGFSYDRSERASSYAMWSHLNHTAQGVRRDGSAALDMCYVACGRLDGYYERPVNAYDIGGGAIIVTEAGGTLTALEGGPFGLYDREIAASNGLIHAEMVREIQTALATAAT